MGEAAIAALERDPSDEAIGTLGADEVGLLPQGPQLQRMWLEEALARGQRARRAMERLQDGTSEYFEQQLIHWRAIERARFLFADVAAAGVLLPGDLLAQYRAEVA